MRRKSPQGLDTRRWYNLKAKRRDKRIRRLELDIAALDAHIAFADFPLPPLPKKPMSPTYAEESANSSAV